MRRSPPLPDGPLPGRWADEAALREAVRQRVPAAWEEVFVRHDEALRKQASRLLPASLDRDDAVGETWLRALRYAPSYDVAVPLHAWLASICARACLTQRSRAEFTGGRTKLLARPASVAVQPHRFDGGGLLRHALRALSRRDRTMLALRFVFGLSGAELARVLDVEPGALRTRMARALGQLRRGPLGVRLWGLLHDWEQGAGGAG